MSETWQKQDLIRSKSVQYIKMCLQSYVSEKVKIKRKERRAVVIYVKATVYNQIHFENVYD